VTINRWTFAVLSAMVFVAGGATTYLAGLRADHLRPDAASRPTKPGATPGSKAATGMTGVFDIDPEVTRRSGIVVEKATAAHGASLLRVPGTVQPNAYRKVAVTSLVSGRIVRVPVELGQSVVPGSLIAEVYSPEVAEARMRYSTMRAEEDAGEAKLTRTERLAALGSASQQELEEVRAEHVRHQTELRQAEARLHLLGLNPTQIAVAGDVASSTLRVTAPQAGVIVERAATAGMAAEPSTVLATIADLSPVWIVADVYERDFRRVAVGTPATVTADAFPGLALHGRVAYVSPDVRPETRTAQVRVEVPNPGGKLRFGMYVTVVLGEAQPADNVTVPRTAVQTIGSQNVVFVADEVMPSRFQERAVTLGEATGDAVAIAAGVSEGERVVTQGSFALRAEAERQGVGPTTNVASEATVDPDVISVAITNRGFEPATIKLSEGRPAHITFTRKTDVTCATDIELPDYGIRRPLPLDAPVTVTITPKRDTLAGFQCAMGMIKGAIVVTR
jgi:membrane fusion protein, heavy metal efflux system